MRGIVFLLSLAGFATMAVMRVMDPLLPIIAGELSISIGRASLVITAYALSYGACVLLYGPLGDRFGKLRVILVAMLLSAVCIAMCGLARDLHQLVFWRFLTGVTSAATVPLSLAFIADHAPISARQSALARYLSGVILGQIIGAGLGGLWSDLLGWRSLFQALGLLTATVCVAIALGARHLTLPALPATRLAGVLTRYRSVFERREGREVMLAVFLEGLCLFGNTAFIGALLHKHYGLGYTAMGALLMSVGAGSLLYSLSARWIIGRLGPRRMIALGGMLMALAFGALVAGRDWRLAAPLLVVLGLAIYLMHNTLQTLATELVPEARGTAVSMMAFVLFAGQASGAWLSGRAIDAWGFGPVFGAAGAALLLLGAWLQGTRVVRRHHAGSR